MSKALIVSVGGSPAPVLYSINTHRPDYLILFASTDSRAKAIQEVLPALSHQPLDREFIMTVDEQNLEASVAAILRRLPEILKTWGVGYDDLVADYTGGTKTMSAALVLALSRHIGDFSYVGGIERDKAGLGIVIDGREQMLHLRNPWNELALEALSEMALLFNRFRFQPVVELADHTSRRAPARKPVCDAIKAAAEAFGYWDSFHYGKAHSKLKEAEVKLKNVSAETDNESLRGFYREVAGCLPFLEAVVAEENAYVKSSPSTKGEATSAESGNAIIRDLLANAVRRAEVECKYDDAVARLYSAIEKMAKVVLKVSHGIDNSNVAPDRIPPGALRDEVVQRCVNVREGEKIQLPLHKSFELLAELGDRLGAAYKSHEGELSKVLNVRNMSLLAHGFEPIRKETYEKMLAIALSFLSVGNEDLPRFPTMRWEGR